MKSFFVNLFFIALSLNCPAQIFDGYKYVKVFPICTYKGPLDKWSCSERSDKGAKSHFEQVFKNKGIKVLPYNFLNWPDEAIKNPGLVMWCFPYRHHNSDIHFKISNFNEKVLLDYNGSSDKGASKEVYDNSQQNYKAHIESYSYEYDSTKRIELIIPDVPQTGETEASLIAYFNQSETDGFEGIYVSDVSHYIPYYKLGIKKYGHQYKIIVLESQFEFWKEGELKALMKEERPDGSYKSTWYTLNKNTCLTHIYLSDHDEIIVRKPNCSIRRFREITFLKIYPFVD